MSSGQPEVLGKYTLIKKLASGGMAEVFLAKVAGPAGFEKLVVVKRILAHLAEEPSFIEMFLAEARLAAQLNHPNVVQVFDFGEQDGTWFLVMELIDGLNLRHLFRKAAEKNEFLPLPVVLRIVTMALEGLAYAHDFVDPSTGAPLNLVHRDVSPDNILVGRNGAVKVVDFGIAKAANQTHLTKTGSVKGKFAYMPPEQLQGQRLDRRADLFAMGIVLYELLSTRKPFDTSNDAVVVRAILYEDFTPVSAWRPDVPPELDAVLQRAFAKDPAQRYADCRSMAADLDRLMMARGESVNQYDIAQLVQRLGGPSSMAVAPTPKPSPSVSTSAPTLQPDPQRVAPTPATVPMDSTHTLQQPPPPTGVTTPAPRVEVRPSTIAPLGPIEAVPTPMPREAPVETTDHSVGSPSRPAVASPAGAAPSFEAIPPPPEGRGAPGWAQAPLHRPAPSGPSGTHRELLVIDDVPQKRSPALLWGSAALAAVVGVGVTWAVLASRRAEPTAAPPVIAPPLVAEARDAGEAVVAEPVTPIEPDASVVGEGPAVDAGPGALVDAPTAPVDAGLVAVVMPTVKTPKPRLLVKPPLPPPPPLVTSPGAELVDFRVRPFGTVSVDGKVLGDTPFPPVKLSPGVHRVQVVNGELGKTVTRTFEVKSGQPNVFRLNLEEGG
ncbi:MAG: protein kinase [Myxococcaceae bacterium]|nr:protein kinase [Myxococcaceae bacterium]